MNLPSDLLSQFVKVTNDDKKQKNETTVYGTTVKYDGKTFVKIDGSDMLTPVSTTADVEDDERVTVMIKDHTATITGNMSSPAARTGTVNDLTDEVTEFEVVMAYKVTTKDLEAVNAIFDTLRADSAMVSDLEAVTAKIETLQAKYANLDHISAKDVEALTADIESLRAVFGEFTDLSTEDLEAINADIDNLKAYTADFTYVSADRLTAIKADIKTLDTEKLSAEDAKFTYANIDFANIEEAAIRNFYAKSGVIQDVVISDGKVTGTLVGVTIKGDLIEGDTVVADKLVIRGEDGLYYKLNAQGISANSHTNYVKMDTVVSSDIEGTIVEDALTNTSGPVYSYVDSEGNTAYYTIVEGTYYAVELSTSSVSVEQTDYNSLNGSIITAKSVTATQISVDDLVAFDATIGGFNIDENALYSGAKAAIDATTSGVYMDSDGQFATGDGANFFKFYKDDDDNYRLDISATSILLSRNQTDLETELDNTNAKLEETSSNLSQEIETQKSEHQTFLAKFSKYIRFMEDENGDPSDTAITIGSGDSAITLELDNEIGIVFKKNGVQFGWWDGVDFHTGNIVVEVNERAQFGNFAYVPRSDGSLSFLKVGG